MRAVNAPGIMKCGVLPSVAVKISSFVEIATQLFSSHEPSPDILAHPNQKRQANSTWQADLEKRRKRGSSTDQFIKVHPEQTLEAVSEIRCFWGGTVIKKRGRKSEARNARYSIL
jgi:hypothetical protein